MVALPYLLTWEVINPSVLPFFMLQSSPEQQRHITFTLVEFKSFNSANLGQSSTADQGEGLAEVRAEMSLQWLKKASDAVPGSHRFH